MSSSVSSSTSSSSSSSATTPLAKNLLGEVSQWVFTTPSRNKFGGFSNFVNRPGSRDGIMFQTTAQEGEPRCIAPFGISKPYDKTGGAGSGGAGGGGGGGGQETGRRNFELSIYSPELHAFVKALNDAALNAAKTNREQWFGGKPNEAKKETKKRPTPTAEQIEGMLLSCLQPGDPDKNYPDRVRTKVNVEPGPQQVRVFLYTGPEFDPTTGDTRPTCKPGTLIDVAPSSECVCIVRFSGMWFMPTQFGLSLTTTDILVFPNGAGFCSPGAFNLGGFVPRILRASALTTDVIVPTAEAAAAAANEGTGDNTGTANGGGHLDEHGDTPMH